MLIPLFIIAFAFVLFITIAVVSIISAYKYIINSTKKEQPPSNGVGHKADHNTDNSTTRSSIRSVQITQQAMIAENTVEDALRHLHELRYFVFRDLIIPSSSRSMSLTQIDHIVVSRKGIFCIETKSNNGNIYGFSRNENWKQYLGSSGEPYLLNSPFRQNRHHVSSLEVLLSNYLKAPVHSYVSFPNARKVVVDGKIEDMSPRGVIAKISRHDKDVYDYSDVESIAKILAHAGSLREQLRERHIDEVKAFLDAKVSQTLKFS